MTYTKRQWFIYRLTQCVKLFEKINIYMSDVMKYVKNSKYERRFRKLDKKFVKCLDKIRKLHQEVK